MRIALLFGVLSLFPILLMSQEKRENKQVVVFVSKPSYVGRFNSAPTCKEFLISDDSHFPYDYLVRIDPGIYFGDFSVSYKGKRIGDGHGYYRVNRLVKDTCSIIVEHSKNGKIE